MRKTLIILLLSAMLVGCVRPQTAQSGLPLPATTAAIETVEVSLEPDPTEAAPTAIATEVPEETRPPEPPDAPKAQPAYIGVTNETPTDPLALPITIKEIDWDKLIAGKQYETKFYNETVNFQDLRVTVADFASDESGTQFSLRLDLPEEWTDLQCLSMNQFMGFRFYLDGKAQHDFRLIDQSPIFGHELAEHRCDSFTMTYRSETVTDTVMHAAHEWKIVPIFYYRKKFAGSNYNNKEGRTYIEVEQGDVCIFNGTEDAYWGGTIGVTELNELSLTLPIEHTVDLLEPTREPKLLQVTVWTEDVERNKAAGHYGPDGRLKDGSYVVYGTYQNVTVDFSELEFHIERFYYWEHGFFYTLYIVYPESWSEEVIQNARFDIEAFSDGEPYGEKVRNGRVARSYFKSAGGWLDTGNAKPYSTEKYIVCDSKRFSLSDPIPKQELTFKVWLEYSPTIRFDNSDKEIDITNGEPYYMESIHEYACDVLIPMTELSISTDTFTFPQGGTQ